MLLPVNRLNLKLWTLRKPGLSLYGLARRNQSPQPFYGVTIISTVGPRCKHFSKCSFRCAPNVLSCAPTAQFTKSCWMCLAFSSCGYTVKKKKKKSTKIPHLTAPAFPLSPQPVGPGMLGPEIRCMQTGAALGLYLVWSLQDTGLILNMVSCQSMALLTSNAKSAPSLSTLASCLWQKW